MNNYSNYPRLLIVGTVPYNRQSTSRAFDAYFHNWEKENIAQVFSDPAEPVQGHCGRLYQITDQRMLQRWFDKSIATGRRFVYEGLGTEESSSGGDANGEPKGLVGKLKALGKRHTPLSHLLRKALWRKEYWCTADFNQWLDEFKPECVFLSFSNDFFILEIALYVARKYNIPICSSTGDDYYFDNRFSLNPLYYIYHEWYKSLNRKVFRHKGSAIYIGDKIRDKYNYAFGLDGETVYLVSDIERRPFKPINPKHFTVRYFGNIGYGRNNSICDIATAISHINPNIKIEVYSGETDTKSIKPLEKHPNVDFRGCIPYTEVMQKTLESDLLLVVEGLTKSDVNLTRYALSTKVADSLASGCNIIGYGSPECGAIEYMEKIGCVTVGHSIDEIEIKLRILLADSDIQKNNYDKACEITASNHRREQSNAKVESIIRRLVEQYN